LFKDDAINHLRQAISRGRVTAGPIDLQLLPTTRCNARCVFCPTTAVSEAAKKSSASRWLPPETDINIGLLDRLFDDLYRLGGLRRLTITGGEPLLYNKIILGLFIIRRNFPDAEIALVTNGILLEKAAENLVKAKLDRVSVSVNAADPESFALQSRTSAENFDKLKRGIKALRKARDQSKAAAPYISLTAVLNKHNFRDAKKMLRLGIDTGADAVTYLALMDFPLPGESPREFALTGSEFSDFMKDMQRLKPLAEKKKIYFGFTGKVQDQGRLRAGELYKNLRCYAGYTFAMVWPDGTVRPCCNCETALGNLQEQSFYQIWNSERARQIRERMRKITELGPPELCDCMECGYLHENQEYHRRLQNE